MLYETDCEPQYRDADVTGFVGLKGYLNYFQDAATHYMHDLDKGNDVIPGKYGVCWLFTKYRMHVEREADFRKILHLETWVESRKRSPLIYQDFAISADGRNYAQGRLESCLFDMAKKRPVRPSSVELPEDIAIERTVQVEPFRKLSLIPEGMEYQYTYQVRYSDLDNNCHMTNLRYIDLLMDALDSGFYKSNHMKDFEIHFMNQSFEGESLKIYRKEEEQGIGLAAVRSDGTAAAVGLLQFAAREEEI